ncbi:MAG TPA: MFS transporter [Pseudonocardiaceae bacterium]|nr:MFS transporter [Pseudonocardiaceae bacterium]
MGTLTRVAPGLGRGYWTLWWSSVVNGTGDGIFTAALPLFAASLTRDPLAVSAVSAATYLPWLLLSLPAGAIVDRRDRLTLMWRSQVFAAAVMGVATLLVGLHRADIAVLCVAGFLLGSADTIFGNASVSVLPELVGPGQLVKGNARLQIASIVTGSFAGPPLGSLLFGCAAWLAFGADGLSFALAAGLLMLVRGGAKPVVRAERRAVGRDIAEGVRWLARHRLLRVLAVVFAVNCLSNQLAMSTLVLLATGKYGLNAHQYGLLLGAMAVGGIAGGLVNTRVNRWLGAVGATVVAVSGNAVLYVSVGLAPNAVVLGVVLAGSTAMTTLWNVSTVSLRQRLVPGELLGRVNGAYKMLGWGLMPVGAAVGGLLASRFGIGVTFPVAGALRAAVLLAALPVLAGAIRRRS